MIHVYIGTKAQLVKMAPIMKELDRRGVQYNFIDAGQHGGLTDEFRKQFELRDPDVRLRRERNNIKSIGQALSWTLSQVAAFGLNRESLSVQRSVIIEKNKKGGF